MWRFAVPILVVFASGCAHVPHLPFAKSSGVGLAVASEEIVPPTTVYVRSNGYHTSLLVRKCDVPLDVWPEAADVPDHPWIEVGWGSEVFYRAERITVPVMLDAIVPNPSVLHIVGWDSSPEETFVGNLVRVDMNSKDFDALCRHIHESYDLDSQGRPQYLGPGVRGDSAFAKARGSYYFPKTCNVWTARGLKKSGVTIVPELCTTADAVLICARASGTEMRRKN